MRWLSRILALDADAGFVEVEPGIRWSTVVAATLKRGLVPPVLTGTLSTTVGGTLSVGGLGHASFRYGTQADNCLGLEVATLDGELRWCDEAAHTDLFQHSLCGLGQFGVITRVRHRLRTHGTHVRRWRLYYTNRCRMLDDLDTLFYSGNADFLAGYGFAVDDRFGYCISIGFEGDEQALHGRERVLTLLAPNMIRGRTVQTFAQFTLDQSTSDDRERRRPTQGRTNPWVDTLLPRHAVRTYFDTVVPQLPAAVRRNAALLFWPVSGRRLTRPLFMASRGEMVVLAGIFPTVPAAETASAAQAMAAAAARSRALGGKRYVYGWIQLDAAGWADHYDHRWAELLRIKSRYDPEYLLNREAITYNLALSTRNAAVAAVS